MNKKSNSQDIIDEKIPKIRAVLNCLLTSLDHHPELEHETIYNILWSIDDDLREIVGNFSEFYTENK